jgi:hypothetical protein
MLVDVVHLPSKAPRVFGCDRRCVGDGALEDDDERLARSVALGRGSRNGEEDGEKGEQGRRNDHEAHAKTP